VGTWGPGNFDSDGACEYRDTLFRQLIAVIERDTESESSQKCDFDELEENLIPSVDILIALTQYYQTSPLVELDKVQAWRRSVLDIYDRTIDDVGPKEKFKIEKRIVIQSTFDKLEVLINQQDAYVRKLRGEG
jgi:hypothetical protein